MERAQCVEPLSRQAVLGWDTQPNLRRITLAFSQAVRQSRITLQQVLSGISLVIDGPLRLPHLPVVK